MNPKKKSCVFLCALVASVFCSSPGWAITFEVFGGLPDLDGDGSSANEQAVLSAALSQWSSLIKTDRTFTLFVSSSDIGGNGSGGIFSFDANDRPNSGGIVIDLFPDGGLSWFVDPTPNDHSEFQATTNAFHFLRPDRPETLDLLTIISHEVGHALGFHSDGSLGFNPRYVDLMSPALQELVEDTRVYLRTAHGGIPLHGDGLGSFLSIVTELSHVARTDADIAGWTGSLMVPNSGFAGERWLPGDVEASMLKKAYKDKVDHKP